MKIAKLIEEINEAINELNLDKTEVLFNELCEEIKLYPEQSKKTKRVVLYDKYHSFEIGYIRLKNPKIILFPFKQDFFFRKNNSTLPASAQYIYKSIDFLKIMPVRKKQYILKEIKRIRHCIMNHCEYEHDNTRDGRWLYLQYRLYKFLNKLPMTEKLMCIYISRKLFRVMQWSERENECYKYRRVNQRIFY